MYRKILRQKENSKTETRFVDHMDLLPEMFGKFGVNSPPPNGDIIS